RAGGRGCSAFLARPRRPGRLIIRRGPQRRLVRVRPGPRLVRGTRPAGRLTGGRLTAGRPAGRLTAGGPVSWLITVPHPAGLAPRASRRPAAHVTTRSGPGRSVAGRRPRRLHRVLPGRGLGGGACAPQAF